MRNHIEHDEDANEDTIMGKALDMVDPKYRESTRFIFSEGLRPRGVRGLGGWLKDRIHDSIGNISLLNLLGIITSSAALLCGIAAVYAAIKSVSGEEIVNISKDDKLHKWIIGLLGLLAAGFGATQLSENSLSRIFQKERSTTLLIASFHGRYRQLVKKGMAAYRKVIDNVGDDRGNMNRRKHYSNVTQSVLHKHLDKLESVANGYLVVEGDEITDVMNELIHKEAYYAAVTQFDLNFWLNKERVAVGYSKALGAAAFEGNRNNLTRIFIISLEEIRKSWDTIVKVIESQDSQGVGWAIVLNDTMHPEVSRQYHRYDSIGRPPVKVPKNRIDFAIIDNGEVMTFFVKNEGDEPEDRRVFNIVFNIKKHRDAMEARSRAYIHLVTECWICNVKFEDNWHRLLPKSRGKFKLFRDKFNELGDSKKYVLRQLKLYNNTMGNQVNSAILKMSDTGMDIQSIKEIDVASMKLMPIVNTDKENISNDLNKFRKLVAISLCDRGFMDKDDKIIKDAKKWDDMHP